MKPKLVAPLLAVALSLGACNQTASPSAAPAAATSGPAGCNGALAEYRSVVDNDLRMGHVNQSVYTRIDRELGQAEAACAAGRDAESVRMVNATKSRYGYR